MSCNGCRVLRKGCSDTCILRPCLQWIDSSDAQGHATVFVAKFFGRAGLMGFISAVPDIQRPALFQSLLYEACGRTVNPVFGAVGLLWSGNWPICQAAVDTVLKGGSLRPLSPSSLSSNCLPAIMRSSAPYPPSFEKFSEANVQEAKERSHGWNKMNMKGWDGNSASGWNRRPCPDLQCDSWKNVSYFTDSQKDHRRQQVYESDQRSAHLYGTYVTPRRVRARVEPFAMEALGSTHKGPEEVLSPASRFEQLELNLTLEVKGDKVEKLVGNKRICSPCESVNSDGSVTSLDSTFRDPAKVSNWSVQVGLMPPPFRTLLPLLQ